MQRDVLLVSEMIAAAEQAQALVADVEIDGLGKDRQSEVPWDQPARLRNRIVHGYWSIDLEILHTTARDQLPKFVGQLRLVLAERGGRGLNLALAILAWIWDLSSSHSATAASGELR